MPSLLPPSIQREHRDPARAAALSVALATLGGALFGLLFPLVGTVVECLRRDLVSLPGALLVQQETPVLWVLDTIPLILAVAGRLVGARDAETAARSGSGGAAVVPLDEGGVRLSRQLLPLALASVVVLAGLLLFYAAREAQEVTRVAVDMDRAGSLRERALWVYSQVGPGRGAPPGVSPYAGATAPPLWRHHLEQMGEIRRALRVRYPDEVAAGDADFAAFSRALDATGTVPWDRAQQMWRSADSLATVVAGRAHDRNQRASSLMLLGALGMLLLFPFGAALLRRLWIAEARTAEQNRALLRSEERFRGLVEVMSDWVWETDLTGQYVYASTKVRESMGYLPVEVVGRSPFSLMTPAEAERVFALSSGIVAARKTFVGLECEMLTKDGRTIYMEVSGSPLFDAGGGLIGYRGVNRDITARKEAEREQELYRARLEELAALDPLTGLSNRRIFIRRLEDAWEREDPSAPLALLLLDADRFKAYNDAFGHLEGDRALLKIASALAENVRETDTAARYGGEEFVVLLPGADAAEAMAVAERLRAVVAAGEWPLRAVTASVGVAVRTPAMQRSSELISAADRALYQSKSRGRDRVTLAEMPPLPPAPTNPAPADPEGAESANECFASGGRPRV